MWSSKSFGSRFKYGFFQTLIRMRLTAIARIFIFPVPFYYSLRPDVRKRASYYLRRRFPNASWMRMFAHTFILYNNFANVLFDRLIVGAGQKIPFIPDTETFALLKDILADGKGCIIVAAHFGSWQNGLAGLKEFGQPIGVVFWQEEKVEHHYFNYAGNVTVINANGGIESAIEMRSLLRKNGILCIMGDRMTPADKASAKVDFMGGQIEIPTFPYRLSRVTGAPVLHTASISEKGKIHGLPSIVNSGGPDAPQIFVSYLKKLVDSHPHNFFNFYDMWDSNR